ncbi:sulfatase-like hydrolase/transferase [Haloterrigena salifodinae]|uniref:sulfatase-like hydrolase/transferase n=1 Tax=Haloterrigena salifodinae TaxID=2675099 RepID=UPI000F885A63|nr:sulfatase-like hydrolase/transferase [Haloterrigena salifodinae]
MDSIAIVVLDTLRYDSFQEHFGWLKGKKYTNAYSTSHWTIPAHASLYTGKYASEVGVQSTDVFLECEDKTIAEVFSAEGYTTSMMSANPNIYMWPGWTRGFDNTVGPSHLKPGSEELVDWQKFYAENDKEGFLKYINAVKHCIKSDKNTTKSIISGLKTAYGVTENGAENIHERVKQTNYEGEEFLYINLMDAHTPYNPPKRYTDCDVPVDVVVADAFAENVDNEEEIKQAYTDACAYLSDVYQNIFQELKKDFDYIITLSDHGEMLGEFGMWNHSYGLYPELVHVPLVISGDDIEDETENTIVSLLDVHKTACELAGINVESRGQDLLDEPESKSRLFEYRGFLHWHRDQFEREGVNTEVYEPRDTALDGFISSSSDYVYQTHDEGLRVSGSLTTAEANEQLEKLVEDIDRKKMGSEQDLSGVSDEVRQQLEDLGYA